LVGENRDLDRENRVLPLRPSVELFAEGHDVDSLRTESSADGGRRVRLACRDLQLDESSDLFCHVTPCNCCARGATMLRASTATVWFIVVVVSDGCAPRCRHPAAPRKGINPFSVTGQPYLLPVPALRFPV